MQFDFHRRESSVRRISLRPHCSHQNFTFLRQLGAALIRRSEEFQSRDDLKQEPAVLFQHCAILNRKTINSLLWQEMSVSRFAEERAQGLDRASAETQLTGCRSGCSGWALLIG